MMKKIRFVASLIVVCVILAAIPFNASAVEEIDFIPELKSGRLYGISLGSTEADVRTAFYGRTVEIKDRNGNTLASGSTTVIGTGFTVKIDGVVYSTVVMGDVDGDGQLKAKDYLLVKRTVLGVVEIGSLGREAAGGDATGKLRPIHYMRIKRACFGTHDMNYEYACDPYLPDMDDNSSGSGSGSGSDTSNDWL